MVSIGYRLWSIWAAVVQGVGLYGRCGLWLPACGDLVKGCALSTFMGIPNCRERPCVAQSLRSTVNWLLVRRNAAGAASQNHRELNHGKTGKGRPVLGAGKRRCRPGQITVVSRQFHGSLEPIHSTFKSRYFPGLGAPKQRPLRENTGKPEKAIRFGAHTRQCPLGQITGVSKQYHVGLTWNRGSFKSR